jgi:pimeloyl-ACP methyl ester carboxylesterase
MPKNYYNTYWPPDAAAPASTAPLYPGITITRDQSFGPDMKDVLDIFMADKGGGNRPVLIYVPGGGGNKIEQQVREGNAFYDNIGRWATENGMVGVLVQRHPATKWDDGGRALSLAVDWIQENIAKYKGDPKRMFIWAHSAGNGPLGVYVGHPDRWKNGVQVKGAIFMSGNPVPTVGPGRGAPGAGAGAGGGRGNAPGSACGLTAGMASNDGKISGPSGQTTTAAFGRGGGGGGRAQLTPEEQTERDNLPGFKATKTKIMIAYAEMDPGVTDSKMPANVLALHDELCKLDGPSAKDGAGRCPAMFVSKGESHMSEVFSIDTSDKNVSGPVLAWIKKIK